MARRRIESWEFVLESSAIPRPHSDYSWLIIRPIVRPRALADVMACNRAVDENENIIEAISALAEHAPKNIIEARLAFQMTATSEAALMFLRRSMLPNQIVEETDLNVARATRLMRLHLEQIEAMQKLKGKTGQQKMTVEHFHVHEGGQAIAGPVSTTKGEGGNSGAEANTP
jgi:hypothetical protein